MICPRLRARPRPHRSSLAFVPISAWSPGPMNEARDRVSTSSMSAITASYRDDEADLVCRPDEPPTMRCTGRAKLTCCMPSGTGTSPRAASSSGSMNRASSSCSPGRSRRRRPAPSRSARSVTAPSAMFRSGTLSSFDEFADALARGALGDRLLHDVDVGELGALGGASVRAAHICDRGERADDGEHEGDDSADDSGLHDVPVRVVGWRKRSADEANDAEPAFGPLTDFEVLAEVDVLHEVALDALRVSGRPGIEGAAPSRRRSPPRSAPGPMS